MAKNQKSYTPEFKQQIVDLYNAGGTSYPQLEREYGVNRSTLSNWVKQLSPIKVSEEETITLKEYKVNMTMMRRQKNTKILVHKAIAVVVLYRRTRKNGKHSVKGREQRLLGLALVFETAQSSNRVIMTF